MVSRQLATINFKQQLKQEYEKGDIIRCFYIYLGFLKHFAKEGYCQFVDWQVEAMEMAIANEVVDPKNEALEVLWNWCRRAGKSRGLTILAVFFALLDYEVIWRAPSSDQLDQAGKWFMKNPFVETVKINYRNAVDVFGSPDINIGVLSEAQVASRECDVLIFDEGGWIFKNRKIYEYYKNSRPMIAASDFRHIIHASTPAIYTAFHEEYNNLRMLEAEYNTKFISEHDWTDCPWITSEFVEKERLKNSDTPWYVEQNYNCMFVVYGGAVFTNVVEPGDPDYPEFPKGFLNNATPTHAGVDFNGGENKHYIVTIRFNDRCVYVLDEIKFTELNKLFDYSQLSLELEDGLFNTQFTEQTKRMGLNCIYEQWDEKKKQIRVEELRNRTIVINKRKCPTTYKNLVEAAYDTNSRLPKLEKRTDQHGLDALLHAMHPSGGRIHVPRRFQPQNDNMFSKNNNRSMKILL